MTRTLGYAGHFPHLPPTRGPTPGYVMPARGDATDREFSTEDLTGAQFGWLKPVERHRTPYGSSYLCVCTRLRDGKPCGRKVVIHASEMLRRQKLSCGCGKRVGAR